MTEDELRALVRQVVQERLAGSEVRGSDPRAGSASAKAPARPRQSPGALPPGDGGRPHPSHLRLRVVPGVEAGGPCLIEPRMACNRCGYCQSYGH